MIGLREDDGWAEETWGRALDAGRPPESGGGGGRGGRGSRGSRDEGDGRGGRDGRDNRDGRDPRDGRGGTDGRDEREADPSARPEDRPWTPIPRQAKAADPGLIPPQRRLKKTSRSA